MGEGGKVKRCNQRSVFFAEMQERSEMFLQGFA
jgi:hypothetical protein